MTSADTSGPDVGLGLILRAMTALLLGVAFLNVGSGALMAIIGVRLAAEGASSLTIGAITSAYFLGLLAGSLFATRVIDRVGHIRAFAVYAAADAISILLLVLVEWFAAWIALRFVAGYCMAGLAMIAESWLNHRATNATRGRVLSLYIIVMNGAFALGPLLLNLGDPAGAGLLVVSGILFVAALLPVALTRTGNPDIGETARLRLRRLVAIAPLGVVGALTIGLVESAFFGLAAVYGQETGLTPARVSLFLTAALGGIVVLQFPIGALSDRVDRQQVILGIALAAAVTAAVIALLSGMSFPLLLALGLVLGGLSGPLYPLSVAEANDYLEPEDFVPASSALVLAYSLGASVGPLAASALMAGLGPAGLFAFIACVLFALAGYTLYRITLGLAKPADEQGEFVPAAHVTAVAAALDPRTPEDPEYDLTAAAYDEDDWNDRPTS